jgi:hypothetical protein
VVEADAEDAGTLRVLVSVEGARLEGAVCRTVARAEYNVERVVAVRAGRGSASAAAKSGTRACVARRDTSNRSAGAPPAASSDVQSALGQKRIFASRAAGGRRQAPSARGRGSRSPRARPRCEGEWMDAHGGIRTLDTAGAGPVLLSLMGLVFVTRMRDIGAAPALMPVLANAHERSARHRALSRRSGLETVPAYAAMIEAQTLHG